MRAKRYSGASPCSRRIDIEVGVVGDQPRGPADLGHDGVAGVDAQPALDAAELRAVADVDAGRADVHALQAVDAVAGGQALAPQRRAFLHRAARLAAIVAIGDVERVLVGQRGLDARPRAHIEADLLAHVAGEHIGREGQDADPEIGDERRVQRSRGRAPASARRRNRAPRRRRSTTRPSARGNAWRLAARCARRSSAPASRRMCSRRSPSIKRSIAWNRSVHTVCGHR